MKRILSFLIVITFSLIAFGQTKTIGGIKYTIISDNEVEVSAETDASDYVKVRIPETVKIKKKIYKVTKIASGTFSDCKRITYISIPNSVTYIGNYAFSGCKRLEEIVLPDIAECGSGIFSGCWRLESAKGNTLDFPSWAEKAISYSPYYDNTLVKIKNTYNYYAQNRMLVLLTEWLKRKEYETSAQYQLRVTEENRAIEMKKITAQVRNEYIEKVKPADPQGRIGTYDADYGIFSIHTENYGNTFAQVPIEEAQNFKDNWSRVRMNPTYGIVGGNLEILSCEFSLNGKIYKSPVSYDKQNTDIAINLSPINININEGTETAAAAYAMPIDKSIDIKIPANSQNNKNAFAIIIGNENYQYVSQVPFAKNDAKIFAAYCRKTLGMPEENVRCYENATYGTMLTALADAKSISEAYNGHINLIFYYAGHGIPNPSDNSAYLLPVDVDGRQTEACFPVSRLYKDLGELRALSVTVFMDACFSGALRGEGMLESARGVAIKTKGVSPNGKLVVFSAASGDETAYPYNEKGHGMFTYFLLKKLNETKGDVTLGELSDYLTTKVRQTSLNENHKIQTPTVAVSPSMGDFWKDVRLR